jgi:AraC family transcriptional regulator, regulatory protein of adaptative response / methylated-DNA-[protein]-cysteine methyltransferase
MPDRQLVEWIVDRAQCDRARLTRDPRFDSEFFTCVKTTKIYCRPICPSAHARQANVFFVPSAAAAERLGFRPCLRCRPETAPGSPAWRGTATSVARAMRLIGEGFLDRNSVEELADKLGVGARHLSRLFREHIGASPVEVAGTRRVQAAKRLISDTAMPLGEIAFEAGFRSVRRFNDAFRKTYKRTPASLRSGSHASLRQRTRRTLLSLPGNFERVGSSTPAIATPADRPSTNDRAQKGSRD